MWPEGNFRGVLDSEGFISFLIRKERVIRGGRPYFRKQRLCNIVSDHSRAHLLSKIR